MTGDIAKTPVAKKKSRVKMRQETAEILDFGRVGVFRGLSEGGIGHIGDQKP